MYRFVFITIIILTTSVPVMAQVGSAEHARNPSEDTRVPDDIRTRMNKYGSIKLDTDPVKLGLDPVILSFDPRPCITELAGTIRYNSAQRRVEVCHQKAWIDWSTKK